MVQYAATKKVSVPILRVNYSLFMLAIFSLFLRAVFSQLLLAVLTFLVAPFSFFFFYSSHFLCSIHFLSVVSNCFSGSQSSHSLILDRVQVAKSMGRFKSSKFTVWCKC